MRSVRDLLRDYNFVNTPEGRRNTVRFFAGLSVLAAGGFMVFFVAFSGSDVSDTTFQEGHQGDQYGLRQGDPFNIAVSQLSSNQWYIGYSTHLYDPDEHERYDPEAIEERIANWENDYGVTITHREEIRSSDVRTDEEHDVLLGYKIQARSPLGLLSRA
jgi:hypothetical protein